MTDGQGRAPRKSRVLRWLTLFGLAGLCWLVWSMWLATPELREIAEVRAESAPNRPPVTESRRERWVPTVSADPVASADHEPGTVPAPQLHWIATGRCVSRAGAALAGVSIAVRAPDSLGRPTIELAGSTTDADGRFALPAPAQRPSHVELAFTHPSHAQLRLPLAGADRPSVVELGDIVLSEGIEVAGRVVSALGEPRGGAHVVWQVRYATLRSSSLARGETSSAVDGTFELGRLPAGELTLCVGTSRRPAREAARAILVAGDGPVQLLVTAEDVEATRVRVISSAGVEFEELRFQLLEAGLPGSLGLDLPSEPAGRGEWLVFVGERRHLQLMRVSAKNHRPNEVALPLRGSDSDPPQVVLDRGPSSVTVRVSAEPGEDFVRIGVASEKATALPFLTRLSVSADGLATLETDGWRAFRGRRVIVLSDDLSRYGESLPLTDAQLLGDGAVIEVALEDGGARRVMVLDNDTGVPISGVRVHVFQSPSLEGSYRSFHWGFSMTTGSGIVPHDAVLAVRESDDRGSVAVPALGDAPVRLRTEAPGYAPVVVPDFVGSGDRPFEIRLTKESTIVALSYGDSGSAQVRALAIGPGQRLLAPTSRTAERMEFRGLAQGSYLVGPAAALSFAMTLSYGDQKALGDLDHVQLIELGPGSTIEIAVGGSDSVGFISGALSCSIGAPDDVYLDVLPVGALARTQVGEPHAPAGERYRLGPLASGEYRVRLFTKHSFHFPVAVRDVTLQPNGDLVADWNASWTRVRVRPTASWRRLNLRVHDAAGNLVVPCRVGDRDVVLDLAPGAYRIDVVGRRLPNGPPGEVLSSRRFDWGAGEYELALE